MSYILHMSDFHFGRNFDLECERLNDLADWILDQRYDIRYVVFTGDIIDSFESSLSCISMVAKTYPDYFNALDIEAVREHSDMFLRVIETIPHLCDEYNNCLLAESSARIAASADVVAEFLGRIGVKEEQFFSCCGNHDRIRLLSYEGSERPCDGHQHFTEELYQDVYAPYNIFCQHFRFHGDYRTHVREHDGIRFVVADTNWRLPHNKESNNMCIHCGRLVDILDELACASDYAKTRTILIAHKPFDDICEDVKFPYHSQMRTVKEIIEDTTVMYLHGDKHSFMARPKNRLKEYMCGAPLAGDSITYNLINYEPDVGATSSIYISYRNGAWKRTQTHAVMEDIYIHSRDSLNREALKLLDTNSNLALTWGKAVNMLLSAINSGRLQIASDLLQSVGDIQVGETKIPFTESGLFEQAYDLIINNDYRMPLNVKGAPGTGKSIFLTVEYIYMLWKYFTGECSHIPLYVNLDKFSQEVDAKIQNSTNRLQAIVEFYLDKVKDAVNRFLDMRKNLCEPVCIIIDGLEVKNTLGRCELTLEESIFQYLDRILDNRADKYVMGFNDHIGLDAERTSKKVNDFQYVLFFSHAITVPFRERDLYSQFIHNYLYLRGQTDPRKIKEFQNAVGKLRKLEINLNTIHTNFDMLCRISPDELPWDVMCKFIGRLEDSAERLFGSVPIEKLCKAAYYLFMRRIPYKNICTQKGLENFRYIDFVRIRNNPDIAEYLIARHYVEQLRDYLEPGSSLEADSILRTFTPRDLSVMIRLVTDKLNLNSSIIDLCEEIRVAPDEMLYSNLVYLIGHDKKYQGAALINQIPRPPNGDDEYINFVLEKSFYLSLICCSPDNRELSNQYILKLMDNSEFRHAHRNFQIHYYEGLAEAQQNFAHKTQRNRRKKKGFDFHDCFLTLVSKLRYSYEIHKPYPLMEIDLFTICDLIYSRLQQFHPEPSWFYLSKYNSKEDSLCVSIIKSTTDLLREYTENYANDRGIDDRILAYFEFMQVQLSEVKNKLNLNRNNDIKEPFVSPANDYSRILNLLNCTNEDWKKTRKNKKCNELIGQHILETIYIAQFFLPDDFSAPGFSKATVISLILMSEVGNLKIGNSKQLKGYRIQSVSHKNNILERQGMREILSLGVLDGYATFKELFPSLTANSENVDINMVICHELKLIQAEYKYYSFYDALDFSQEQRDTFERMYQQIKTSICKDIRNKLITENPAFENFFKRKE